MPITVYPAGGEDCEPPCCNEVFCFEWSSNGVDEGVAEIGGNELFDEDRIAVPLRIPATTPGTYAYASGLKYDYELRWSGSRWEWWEPDIYGTAPDTKLQNMGNDPWDPSYNLGGYIIIFPVDCAGGTGPTPPTPPTPPGGPPPGGPPPPPP